MEQKIKDGYSPYQRITEIFSIIVFGVLITTLIWRIVSAHPDRWLLLLVTNFIIGLLLADFVSGFVHWSADTWGSVNWPIIGPSLIRTFREHHLDQTAITRHDFIETNGACSLISLPVLASLLFISVEEGLHLGFIVGSLVSMCVWVLLTNQIHKYAHSAKKPQLIQWLQKYNLILSPVHHSFHHRYPFTIKYCITTGWMNFILDKIYFFRALEKIITFVTGAQPREEDLLVTSVSKSHLQQGTHMHTEQKAMAEQHL